MRCLKMFGLAAVAAAVFGVGTASATVFCEVNKTSGCGGSISAVGEGTSLVFSAEQSVVLTGPFGLVIFTCTTSTIEGTTATAGSATEPVSWSVGKLTFQNCTRPVTTKNTAGENTWGTVEVHHIAGTDNGTVRSNDTTLTVHQVPFSGTCHYLTNNADIGTLTGKDSIGGIPTIDLSGTIGSENGCPSGNLEGNYRYTGTTPFNVAAS